MSKQFLLQIILLVQVLLLHFNSLTAQPSGFSDRLFVGGFDQAVGITFDANGRMFVWEKAGKVWIVDDGIKSSLPLIDISEEVGGWRDFGLVGFALDPDFLSNGYIYLLYIVDRHHLLNYGTSAYNANTDEYFNATIGRITRYRAEASTNFTTVDYSSRTILFGETPSTGMPSLHESHGVGALAFGTDGTLLATLGDGASYVTVDQGAAGETYYQAALNDGILRSDENVGAYRCQKLNSFNGKVIRIDPATGEGLPSNPFYDATHPRSAQSRTWALGVRNPYRMCLKPETGSHDPAAADPGDFYFGDVGWATREELNVITQGGQNFGWPKYEGMTYQPGYNDPTYTPATHERPKVDWRNGSPRVLIDGNIYAVGSSNFPGPTFDGNASTGGVWYTGDDFPVQYQNTYFHADYGQGWIRNFSFDVNHNPTAVRDFSSGLGPVVYLATSPIEGGVYYVSYPGEIRKISYVGGTNQPPVVNLETDKTYGPGDLTVQFTGDQSYDPEQGSLTYLWDFGDGSATSTQPNPSHTFSPATNDPTSFTVALTVTDNQSLSETATVKIHLNNTPPDIQSVSIDPHSTFSHTTPTTLNLSASVSDAEHPATSLTYSWQTSLYHNNHHHDEAIDNNVNTSTVLSPLGCDGVTYWYQITLLVSDPEGLSTEYTKDLYPDCSGTVQQIDFAPIPDKFTTSAPFTVSASSDAGLPVTIYRVDGPALLSAGEVQLTGAPGTVVLRAVQGGDGTYQPAVPVERSFRVRKAGGAPSDCTATGDISVEYWRGYSGRAVTDIPLQNTPDETGILNVFEIPVNDDDNYGARIRGYICPPETGTYQFWIASDDNGELWLSTNDDPANKQLIANVPNWANSREWDKFPEQSSSAIYLIANQRYYIEALMKEQTGGDNLAVGWQRPDGTQQRPIPGVYLAPWDGGVDPTPDIFLSTTNTTVTGPFEVMVSFSESVTGLTLSDFVVTNGAASNLRGSDASYDLTILPTVDGVVSVQLPAGTVDGLVNPNNASNLLTITYEDPNLPTCDNITDGGLISGDETSCDVYDPGAILSLSSASGGSGGIDYLWQISSSSAQGPWSNLTAMGANFDPGSITQTQWYRRLARRENCTAFTGLSNVVVKEVDNNCGGGTTPPSGYCESRGTSPWVEWITQVTFGTIDNSSGKNGYLDQTDQRTTLNRGGSYPLTLSPGLSWSGYRPNLYWRVWIDFNRDADFNDPGELVLSLNTVASGIEEDILIPNAAELGATRMRIALQKDAYPEACEVFANGEVEDYLVEIQQNGGNNGDQTPPTVILSTASTDINAPVNVAIDVSEDISGLSLSDFQVENATLSSLSGNGLQYNLTLAPVSAGAVSLFLPANKVADGAGNGNTASNTLQINYTPVGGEPAPSTYCNAIGQQPWFEWIANVTFGSIDNDSNKELYGDFTSESTSVNAGSAYPISILPGFSWFQWDEHIRVWIDYNRDGDFEDSGELALSAIRPADRDGTMPMALTGHITVPFSASEGRTRMRVAMQREAFADPCDAFTYGEVEDYEINIINGGGGNNCAITATTNQVQCDDAGTPNDPADDLFTFELLVSGINTGANWETGSIGGSYGVSTTMGPYLISDGAVDLSIQDVSDVNCRTIVNVPPPPACSTPTGGGGPGDLPSGYCSARGTAPWTEWIGEVQFGAIDHASLKELYGDFTDQYTTVTTGLSYSISITPYFSWTHRDEYIRVWIDFNRDGDFTDANELAFEVNHPGGPDGLTYFPVTGNIEIPIDAALGATRMRIAMNRDEFPEPCGEFVNGEVEDYAIEIISSGNLQGSSSTREVLGFAARLQGKEVALDWLTNTGYKNAYYLIERSSDGRAYLPIREIINFDDTDEVLHYNQVDDSPLKGANYYRLKQIHRDGSYVISEVQKVLVGFERREVALYPNPTTDRLYVDLRPYRGMTVTIRIYDLNGQLQLERVVSTVGDSPEMFDLSGVTNGFYALTVQAPGKRLQYLNFVVNRLY